MSTLRKSERLAAEGYDDTIVFSSPDYENAIIGVSTDGRAIYDYDKMIECLCIEDGMSEEDAADFISYNTIRSLDYYPDKDKAPIIMYKLEDE